MIKTDRQLPLWRFKRGIKNEYHQQNCQKIKSYFIVVALSENVIVFDCVASVMNQLKTMQIFKSEHRLKLTSVMIEISEKL